MEKKDSFSPEIIINKTSSPSAEENKEQIMKVQFFESKESDDSLFSKDKQISYRKQKSFGDEVKRYIKKKNSMVKDN